MPEVTTIPCIWTTFGCRNCPIMAASCSSFTLAALLLSAGTLLTATSVFPDFVLQKALATLPNSPFPRCVVILYEWICNYCVNVATMSIMLCITFSIQFVLLCTTLLGSIGSLNTIIAETHWMECLGNFFTFILSRLSIMAPSSEGGEQYAVWGLSILLSVLVCGAQYNNIGNSIGVSRYSACQNPFPEATCH